MKRRQDSDACCVTEIGGVTEYQQVHKRKELFLNLNQFYNNTGMFPQINGISGPKEIEQNLWKGKTEREIQTRRFDRIWNK